MTKDIFAFPAPFLNSRKKQTVSVVPLKEKNVKGWERKQTAAIKNRVRQNAFDAKPGQVLFIYDKAGDLEQVLVGINDPLQYYDLSCAVDALTKELSETALKKMAFELDLKGTDNIFKACTGWGWACYRFNAYKQNDNGGIPKLLWPRDVDKNHVQALINSVCLIRNLINIPANDMGPSELEKTAAALAKDYNATLKIVSGKTLQDQYPLVHMVGSSSPRAPRLIDMKWGNPKHPKVTLVGKGVCFDTGGLDLKPSGPMLNMKKDMGGAAHVLALAMMIMSQNLPVRLRVLIPAVENSTSGAAFRPRDIVKSRKGLSVEVGNTDAEGRLVLADALTLACEENIDLLIDFATLTGSKMATLGPDIVALLSNNEKLAGQVEKSSAATEDPVCALPLWQPYRKKLNSDSADIINVGTGPGDTIHAALFLQEFIDNKTDWLHLDIYAWEDVGRPGRSKGGADTGMRSVFHFLKSRYKT